jgi:AcrR family transcriptional regulator
MKNKLIQEQRMRGYFIQATKELLKGEGLKSINVRTIADQAGYSFATLYNYFKDVKELVFLCVNDFQDECESEIRLAVKKTPRGIEKIKAITKAYVLYFVQYPSVFNLFFIEKLGEIGQKQPTATNIFTFLERLCAEEWAYYLKNQTADESKIALINQQLNYVTCGMLVYYMNRIQPPDYKVFIDTLDIQLDTLLDRL